MNSAFILVLVVGLLVAGRMTIGRWLQRAWFPRPSAEVNARVRGLRSLARGAGLTPALLTLTGVTVASYWGWAPGLTWILVGGALVALIFDLGNRYWSQFISAGSPFTDLAELGSAAQRSGELIWLLVLLVSAAAMLTLSAALLTEHPGVPVALAMSYLAWCCWRRAGGGKTALLWGAASAVCILLGLLLAQHLAIRLDGEWLPAPDRLPWLGISGRSLWVVLLVVLAVRLGRATNLSARSLDTFSGWIFAALTALLLAALVIHADDLDLPAHIPHTTAPSFFSLFALVLLGGTISAVVGIVVTDDYRRQHDADLPPRPTGGHSVDMLFAAVALVSIALLGQSSGLDSLFDDSGGGTSMESLLGYATSALAYSLETIGVPAAWAFTGPLLVLLLTSLALLARVVRLCDDFFGNAKLTKAQPGGWCTPAGLLLVALPVAAGGLTFDVWLLLGILGATLVACYFLIALWAVAEDRKPSFPLVCAGIGFAAMVWVQGALGIGMWFGRGDWPYAAAATAILLLGGWLAYRAVRLAAPRLKRSRSVLDLSHRKPR